MKLKSFFAGSVEAALGLAREELGAEAVLVESRKAPPEARHLGEFEVVAAVLPKGAATSGSASRSIAPAEESSSPVAQVVPPWAQELAELRRQMERLRSAVWQTSASVRRGLVGSPDGSEALGVLLEAGVEPQLAHEIAACVEARCGGDPLLDSGSATVSGRTSASGPASLPWEIALRAELERRVRTDPTLGRPGGRPKVAALVGPPGAGKTTALVKLAARIGLGRKLAIQFISMDTYRIAGAEPLRTYAAVLGAPFRSADTSAGLRQALAEGAHRDLILIDTPGFGPGDSEAAEELAEILLQYPEVEVHLTLAATTRNADLTSAVDRFEVFRPSKLVFTRLDEASALGPAFSEAVRTAKAVSFLSLGQRIPEDLEEADRGRLIDLLLGMSRA